jgi:diguanylate cyclase
MTTRGIGAAGTWGARRVAAAGQADEAPATMLTVALRHAAVVNLALLDACILDMDRVATSTFRHDLTESRTALEHAPTATVVQMVERRVALSTQAYLRTRAELIEAREQEFEETVALLAGAVMQFRHSNSSFSEEVWSRSDQLARSLVSDDLGEHRSRILQGLKELCALAVAKQQEDARQLAILGSQVRSLETRLADAVVDTARDGVTGLPTRLAWEQQMEELARRLDLGDTSVAITLLDIDHFKSINDTHGHAAGDQSLRTLAGCLRDAFGADDFVARFGGDEFAVLIHAPAIEHAAEHLRRLFTAVHQSAEDRPMPVSRTGRTQTHAESDSGLGSQIAGPAITISAGLAGARPGDTVETLIGRADRALYAAKAAGRNRIVVDSAA